MTHVTESLRVCLNRFQIFPLSGQGGDKLSPFGLQIFAGVGTAFQVGFGYHCQIHPINIIYQKQDKSNIVREIYWLYITKRASFILTVDCWLALLSLPPYLHILCSMDINSSLLYFPYQSLHRSNHTRHRSPHM